MKKIVSELLSVAKVLAAEPRVRKAGTWALPKSDKDIAKILLIIKNLKEGDDPLPKVADPGTALYPLLGDDELFDVIADAQEVFYEACARAIVVFVKKMAKEDPEDFNNPAEYKALVELAKRL